MITFLKFCVNIVLVTFDTKSLVEKNSELKRIVKF